MTSRIYLDHAATSPLRPQAAEAMQQGFAIWANPSSPHAEGRKAKAALEDARARIKTALKWDGELIFTSGASEALAIALGRAKVDRRIISAVEHDAVFRAAGDASGDVAVLPVDGDAVPNRDILHAELAKPGRAIVAIQQLNSETGSFIPVNKLAEQVRAAGGLVLSDCSQSAGKFPLPDCDMAAVSAHKFGGPIGIGALLVKEYGMLSPSGGHERGYRAGTENLPGAMGMAAALELAGFEHWAIGAEPLIQLKQTLEQGGAIIRPGMGSAHIRAVAHPTLSAQSLVIRLDSMGFAVSAGSACSSGTLKKSRVLDAFGVDDEAASRTIRVSMGWNTSADDLDAFAEAWRSLT